MRNISGILDIRDLKEFEEYYNLHKISLMEEDVYCPLIHSLRMIKTPLEIEKIRKAIRVSHEAFSHIEKIIQSGMYEYEIEAEIARIFRKHHLTEAYATIVASGPNTCTLHYTQHTRCIQDGDLVLIDAGSEYMGYASDTTRTLFVGDTMPEREKQVYESVLRVKLIAENTLKPHISFAEYELIVMKAMIQELQNLWLIPENSTEEIKRVLSRKYYPHKTSHFLGLDVHDVGPRDIVFLPGMVLTIEPGIYIREENIGVRIEDDYLVTDSGCEKLL
jgi:Xaa-Pro aminopeptidase